MKYNEVPRQVEQISLNRQAPGEAERSSILRTLLAPRQSVPDAPITDPARQTAAFAAGDLASLVIRTSYAAFMRVMQVVYVFLTLAGCFPLADCALSRDGVTPNDTFSAGVLLTNPDFGVAMDETRSSYSQNIGAPKIPNVSWDDASGTPGVF